MPKKKNLTPAQGRVLWLLDHFFGGNRSKMCRATGISMTAIVKVVTGQQDAGRRLLEKLTAKTDANPTWLLTGEGPPLRGSGLPVTDACLPGSPDNSSGLDGAKMTALDALYSPTRYWLKLAPGEWAVQPRSARLAADTRLDSDTLLAAGDLLLMEADRKQFPPPEDLGGRWCAVSAGGRPARLARLDFTSPSGDGEPGVLEAETFRSRVPKSRRLIVDELPDGEFRVTATEFTPGERGPARSRTQKELPPFPEAIQPSDVVAVCILVVRRFGVPTK